MAQYIDKSALVAEIQRRIKEHKRYANSNRNNMIEEDVAILSFINSMQEEPKPKFHVGDRVRKINRKEFDRDMSVERVYKDYYLCNNIGKFSSTTIPFAEEDDYELIKD